MTTIDEKAFANYEALCADPNLTSGRLVAIHESIHSSANLTAPGGYAYFDRPVAICSGMRTTACANAALFAESRTMGPLLAVKVRELEAENVTLRAQLAASWGRNNQNQASLVREIKTRVESERRAQKGLETVRNAFKEELVNLRSIARVARKVMASPAILGGGPNRMKLAHLLALEASRESARPPVEASTAEADALLLAERMDDFDFGDAADLDIAEQEALRAVVARVLKAAGKTPRSFETRALTGDANSDSVYLYPAGVHMPEPFAQIPPHEPLTLDEGATILAELADGVLPSVPPAMGEPDHEAPADTTPATLHSKSVGADFTHCKLEAYEVDAAGKPVLRTSNNPAETTCPTCLERLAEIEAARPKDGRLWAFVVADASGALLLDHDPELLQHLDGEKIGSPIDHYLKPPGAGIWHWEGTATWSGGYDGDGSELTLDGEWRRATVENAITTETPALGAREQAIDALVLAELAKGPVAWLDLFERNVDAEEEITQLVNVGRDIGGAELDESIRRLGLVTLHGEGEDRVIALPPACRHCRARLGLEHTPFCSAVHVGKADKRVSLAWCGDKDPVPDGPAPPTSPATKTARADIIDSALRAEMAKSHGTRWSALVEAADLDLAGAGLREAGADEVGEALTRLGAGFTEDRWHLPPLTHEGLLAEDVFRTDIAEIEPDAPPACSGSTNGNHCPCVDDGHPCCSCGTPTPTRSPS